MSDFEWTELELYLGMNPSDTSIWWDRGTNQGKQLKPGVISVVISPLKNFGVLISPQDQGMGIYVVSS